MISAHLCFFSGNEFFDYSPSPFLGQESCHLPCLYNPAIWSRNAVSYAVFNNIATDCKLILCKGDLYILF